MSSEWCRATDLNYSFQSSIVHYNKGDKTERFISILPLTGGDESKLAKQPHVPVVNVMTKALNWISRSVVTY